MNWVLLRGLGRDARHWMGFEKDLAQLTREQYQVQSTGISNFKWTEYIANIERVIPPAQLRMQFWEIVAPMFSEIATVGLKIQNLRRTRDLLLPRLLSGQINVDAAN